jgi:hypothetical protein
MKHPLLYLLLTRLKNQLMSWIKSPGKLIYSIFLLAMLILVVVTGNRPSSGQAVQRDIGELLAGLFALYLIIFVLMAKRGFDSGASLFSLADVNLVFTAPFRSSSVLFFGLVQQMGTSLLLGLFLVFQYSWMQRIYGVSFGTLLLMLLCYALTVFFAQLTAMVLYSFISADEKRALPLKIFFYGLVAVYAVWAAVRLLTDTSRLFEEIALLGSHQLTFLFPVAGWISGIVAGAANGSSTLILTGSLLCAFYLVILIGLVIFSRADYYEDVLKTTEMNFSAITARKEGKVAEAAPRRVRLGRTGLNRGQGASAFYYKHVIENRRGRVLILSPQSLVFVAAIIFASVFMKSAGVIGIFAFSTYMQLFSSALGRLVRELTKPYIYLVPEPPLKKLLYNVRESVPGTLAEAVIIFVPLAFILGLSLPEMIFCILARFTFAYLFIAGNILVERVFGTVTTKMLIFFFYFVSLMLMALPGIVLAVLLSVLQIQLISAAVTTMLALAIPNIAVTMLVFYLCRDVLQYAELNNR